MKNQIFGVFFYVLYLVAMMRPVMPFLDYMVNYNYIAEALCENRDKPYLECNGKCYLEEQLSQVNHDSHGHNSPVPKIDLKDYPVSLVDAFHEDENQKKDFKRGIHPYNFIALQEFINLQDKPPKFTV